MKRFPTNRVHLFDETSVVERLDVLEGPTGRRSWSDMEKIRIIRESLEPGARVCDVARRNGLTPQHLSTWRSLAKKGKLNVQIPEEDFPAFATLEVAPDAPTQSTGVIEIEANGVVVRLAPGNSAIRIAEIATALRAAR